MYSNFEFYAPTQVLFGRGTEARTGEMVRHYGGTKVLIHYGSGSVVRSGLLARVIESLDAAGIAHVELGGVVPNPHIGKVYEGIELGRKEDVDFLLAVGGGSVIDSAKAIGYGLTNEGDVWDLFEHTRTASSCMPLGVILTIAAAGSETSSGSVITDEKTGRKRAYDSNLCRPKFAVLNPELTMTLPPYQTSSGIADILMHSMERYFHHRDAMDITDSISETLMRNVMKYARLLVHEPDNYKARAEIMWSGSLSHNDLTGCGSEGGDWSCHNLEHELGGMFDVAHGAGLASLWGSWARYVHKAAPHRFVKFAVNVLGVAPEGDDETIIEAGIRAMEQFYHDINMPTSIKELGVEPTDEQIVQLAEGCTRACGGTSGVVIPLTKDDMIKIYHMAK